MTKKILVTGATSGIGQACAELFAEKGYQVLAVGRRQDRLAELKNCKTATLDLKNEASLQKFLKDHSEWLDGLDVLINNAGLALGRDLFQESQISDAIQMMETNVLGLLKLTHALLPKMIPHKKGDLIHLGSVAGRTAYKGGAVYSATKAAVHMITDSLRIDLAGTGLRACTIAPGRVETEFSLVRFKGDKQTADSVYQGFRPLTARDIAETILWVVERPAHVNIQDVLIMGTDQPNATTVVPLQV